MTLVDTNILLDVATDNSAFFEWSLSRLEAAALAGPLFINSIIYAELSPGYQRIEEVDDLLDGFNLEVIEIPRAGLFLAGKIFLDYKQQSGPKTGVLPDFFIGAHAAVTGMPLLTRDRRRYATYFPTVELIAPDHA